MPLSRVSAVLKRIGMGKLGRLGLEPAVRYESASRHGRDRRIGTNPPMQGHGPPADEHPAEDGLRRGWHVCKTVVLAQAPPAFGRKGRPRSRGTYSNARQPIGASRRG